MDTSSCSKVVKVELIIGLIITIFSEYFAMLKWLISDTIKVGQKRLIRKTSKYKKKGDL
jgi:hypothetical protein